MRSPRRKPLRPPPSRPVHLPSATVSLVPPSLLAAKNLRPLRACTPCAFLDDFASLSWLLWRRRVRRDDYAGLAREMFSDAPTLNGSGIRSPRGKTVEAAKPEVRDENPRRRLEEADYGCELKIVPVRKGFCFVWSDRYAFSSSTTACAAGPSSRRPRASFQRRQPDIGLEVVVDH